MQATTTAAPVNNDRQAKNYQKLVATIERVQRRYDKAERTVARDGKKLIKLERQRRKLQTKLLLAQTANRPVVATVTVEPKVADDGIPDFLRRTREGQDKDRAAAEAVRKEQADRKRTKSQVRVEKMLAKKAGDTKKMPLSGKDALAAIRGS